MVRKFKSGDWVKVKGKNFYFRTLTELFYREEKNMPPPGPGSLYDYLDQLLNVYCYFDTTEIQNAINFITDDLIPSLITWNSANQGKPIVDKWGGYQAYKASYEANRDFIGIDPDFEEGELMFSALYFIRMLETIKSIFQQSLDINLPYGVYVH